MPKFDPRASRGRRRAVTASARFAVDVLEPRRLFAFGQLDPTFDGDGYKVSDLPAPRVLVTESGKTVVVNIFAVDRLTTSGAFDTTFAGTGEVVIRDIRVEHAMQMSNGKMLLFGRTDDASGSVSSVIRLNIDGSRDATFGVGGIAPTGLASNDLIEDAAFSTNGTILVAGGRLGNAGGTSTISVARLTSAGAIDTTFAGDGVANDVEQIGGYLKPSTVADYYTDVAKLVPMPDAASSSLPAAHMPTTSITSNTSSGSPPPARPLRPSFRAARRSSIRRRVRTY